tara:strand:+ start:5480 stop:5965 length:486 start_codon:yes stop_codon:yes gene_type:complete
MLHENQELENNVKHYIDHTLNIRKTEFDNLPVCPYAARFRDSIKIKIAKNTPYEVLSWSVRNWTSMDVCWVLAWSEEDMPNARMAEKTCDGFTPIMDNAGATLLLDHPDLIEPVGGVYTGFGKGMLIIIQNTDILNRMRKQLLKTDYYKHWSDDDKRELCE